jgi:hypothetical protein
VDVDFFRIEDKGRLLVRWDAVRARGVRVPGTLMGVGHGGALPHDLGQYVVEAATGYQDGFWGLLAKGATFKTTGRKRTRPGRAVIAEHRAELLESEQLAARHLVAWHAGEATPVTEALDRALDQWTKLQADQRIHFAWPSAVGAVIPA